MDLVCSTRCKQHDARGGVWGFVRGRGGMAALSPPFRGQRPKWSSRPTCRRLLSQSAVINMTRLFTPADNLLTVSCRLGPGYQLVIRIMPLKTLERLDAKEPGAIGTTMEYLTREHSVGSSSERGWHPGREWWGGHTGPSPSMIAKQDHLHVSRLLNS